MIVLKKFKRCVLHKHYVESRILELRNDICQDALNKGTINVVKRKLLFKYNKYLIKLNGSNKKRFWRINSYI